MKRIFLFALIPFVFCCVSCSQQKKITLPFSAAEVEEVEVYQFSVPAQAEQKRVTAREDIQNIVALLTTVTVAENPAEQTAGGTTTSFRFRLSSGSDYEIIYVSYGVKNGELKSPHAFHYRTQADIGSIWNQLDYEAVAVETVELPAYGG